MSFKVHMLGCGSATPTLLHLPSCQVVEHNGRLFMVDCGEGAQLSMRRQSLSFSKLRHIFISHLHGDHAFGLPGLLSTLTLHDYTGEMHVYMMAEGIEAVKHMISTFAHEPQYTLIFHPIEVGRNIIYSDKTLEVETIPLVHSTPAVGFIFREKPKGRPLIAEMLEHYNVPIRVRPALKEGADFVRDDGTVIPNKWLTRDPEPPRSYAYCSDTVYLPRLGEQLKGVTTIYHEATYADDMAHKARARGHTTSVQAAKVALAANPEKLVIGHYSKQYAGVETQLLDEARAIFPNTVLANEGLIIDV